MKTKFVEIQAKTELPNNALKELLNKIPNEVYITYSVQYKNLAEKIKNYLKKSKKIKGFQQVLGCSKLNSDCENFLLIGSGMFHAYNLIKQCKNVWIFDGNTLKKLSSSDFFQLEKNKKAALLNFHNAENIGILVSTKPGQQNLKKALELKNKLEKKSYLFLSNNINLTEFENFPNIKVWINTACPGMAYDSPKIINLTEINVHS